MLPASNFSHHFIFSSSPAHHSLFPHCLSTWGSERASKLSRLPWKLVSRLFVVGAGERETWVVKGGGKLSTMATMLRALGILGGAGWGEIHPGLQDATKLLPVLGDTQRGCVCLLGLRHGERKAGMSLGYPRHWCISFCTERQERSEEHARWLTIDMMKGGMLGGILLCQYPGWTARPGVRIVWWLSW